MSKRGATSDLNHDNWDEDQPPETSGEFSKASEDVLKARVVKKARRRNPIGSYQNDGSQSNAFGGFSAFSSKAAPTPSFNFLANLTPNKSGEPPKTNGMTEKNAQQPLHDSNNLDEYYGKLKGLNESVSEWIQQHVNENPLIDLQPVFKDYEKYMKDLDSFKADLCKKDEAVPVAAPKPLFSFAQSSSTVTSTSSVPKFTFGTASPPKFSFGVPASTAAPTFSFGSSLPSTATPSPALSTTSMFSFGGPATKSPATVRKAEDEGEFAPEEDEPPKADFTPVVEKDHIYTIRCKVFVKKDNAYGDRGVGNLYLKPIPDKDKVQLIVRADTNLGNLLCNFILSDGIPVQRMGKKDVMLVCLPTPDSKPPPATILLRVKSPEDADDLLQTLQKYKK